MIGRSLRRLFARGEQEAEGDMDTFGFKGFKCAPDPSFRGKGLSVLTFFLTFFRVRTMDPVRRKAAGPAPTKKRGHNFLHPPKL